MDLSTNTLFISRDVIFHEGFFPFASIPITDFDSSTQVIKDTFVSPISIPNVSNPPLSVFDVLVLHSDDNFITLFAPSPPLVTFDQVLSITLVSPSLSIDLAIPPLSDSTLPIAEPPSAHTKRSTRVHKPPIYLQDYSCNATAATASSSTPYDIATSFTYSHMERSYHSYLMSISSSAKELEHFFQVVKDPAWREAMDKEIVHLRGTILGLSLLYLLERLPLVVNGCTKSSSIERYKARLVAKGYTQRDRLDFLETFSLVAKNVLGCYLLLLLPKVGDCISWTLTMPSFMEILMKRCICACHLVFTVRGGLLLPYLLFLWFADWLSPYMA